MSELRGWIQDGRKQYSAGKGTVLDALLRQHPQLAMEESQCLLLQTGARGLPAGAVVVPEFDRLNIDLARQLQVLAFRMTCCPDLQLAMADPWDERSFSKAVLALGETPNVWAASGAELAAWLGEEARPCTPEPEGSGHPVIAFVNLALRDAYRDGASDIHFECDRTGVTVRLRQDGVMQMHGRLNDVQRAEEVISRIKVMAQLDITERRVPQDGRFRMTIEEGRDLDLRVSIMPSIFGEDAVLRLLDKARTRSHTQDVTLETLGFDTDSRERINALADLPHGMLLVTGPTGSGKTTTLYAVLADTNNGQQKIVTIEDPVEYELAGVLQIPVNERKGLTFAKGLRSTLRHDPDRILVGEIRDAETAEIAVQSALTGHQVCTTVHANSIFDVISRFRHFGLDMHGFMSALNGVVVQRLVRRLCTACSTVGSPTTKERQWLDRQGCQTEMAPRAVGCSECRGTGYRGRSVVAEVHNVDDELRDMVTSLAPISVLRSRIDASGAGTLSNRAANLISQRQTTYDEIRRVIGCVW